MQALSRLSLSDVDPKAAPSASPEAQALAAAVTQRKGLSPFAGRELNFEALEESAELIDFAGEPSELASLPTAPELVASREPLPAEPAPREGRGLFFMSLLLFLSAVLFALWRLGVLAQL